MQEQCRVYEDTMKALKEELNKYKDIDKEVRKVTLGITKLTHRDIIVRCGIFAKLGFLFVK